MPRPASDLIQWLWEAAVRHGSIRYGSKRAARFGGFGRHSQITFPSTVLAGQHRIAIGEGTMVGPYATLSVGMPATAHEPGPTAIHIGDGCLLGKGLGVVAHERIEIGDEVFTGHDVYITDQNHGYEDLEVAIGLQLWKNDPVRIGAGSWLGHGSVVLPGTQLGVHTVVAAGAVVAGAFPDRCVLAGVPARPVRHHDGTRWVRTQHG